MPPSSRGGMGLMSSLMGPKSAASFRPKEKYLIFLVLATFCFVCFGAIFFLPNTDSKSGEKTLIVFLMSSPGSKIEKKRENLSKYSNLKYLIFLVLATFCFRAIFFLPNTDSESGENTLIIVVI